MSPSPPALDARPLVQDLLQRAAGAHASDLHLEPTPGGFEVRCRVDGLLTTLQTVSAQVGQAMAMRLLVMAQLLTYRLDVPQEGRASVTLPPPIGELALRVALMPTIHGPRVAVRLPAELHQPRTLAELDLPAPALAGLRRFADADEGMLLVTGPAGAGKTTCLYALLADIAQRHAGLSVIALEDPVERALAGVTQIQVQPFGELTYERALVSILRQDPQVLMLGEIRDAATAALAVQAALSGHRLAATLHAGHPAQAIARLLEMQLEPYQVAGVLHGVLSLRLLRRTGADGYRGRVPVASYAAMDDTLRHAIVARGTMHDLTAAMARQPTYQTLHACAAELVDRRITDTHEVARALGPPH
jgi:type II secretory ATPase GspE/PulE/Tfp pilus assembly ATPase PilB-like protein